MDATSDSIRCPLWRRLSPALFTLLLFVAGPALAADYYVDVNHPDASDSNPGTEQRPWKSLYAAADHALQPGDTVIVKAGLYRLTSRGSWNAPAINPRNSGTADQPITFRSEPRHGAILETGRRDAAAIGSRDRHHIVIDGFTVRNTGPKGIAVFGSATGSKVRGVIIQNNIIHDVKHTHPTDNTDGIRIEQADGAIVRNNLIYDVHNGTSTHNAAGVKLYWAHNTLVENNEIHDVGAGIWDKRGGRNTVVRRNLVRNCTTAGLMVAGKDPVGTNGHANSRFYQNIVDGCNTGFKSTSEHSLSEPVHVYNNVFANYRDAGAKGSPSRSSERLMIYNNIFSRGTRSVVADFYNYQDPPITIGMMNFNLYVAEPSFLIGRYQTNRRYDSLATWQAATGFDRDSLVGAAAFVNAAEGDFTLQPWCIAKGAGRKDGRSNGEPVDIGAYPDGYVTIGLLESQARPAPPRLLEVR